MGKKQSSKNVIDLHGAKYAEVEFILSDELFWKGRRNCHIITGNSEPMRKVVFEFLEKHEYKYVVKFTNTGEVIVVG